ncbi:MAG: type II toxin-antitoxin system HicA family toxin [Clostridia bacterium]|nr:type II toxin-antitoxin system HicA family toxin [Clostridia bacterium]
MRNRKGSRSKARLTPVSWAELVKRLRDFGFEGPYRGGKHLCIPNPHRREIGVDLLSRILKQAGISREDWLRGQSQGD